MAVFGGPASWVRSIDPSGFGIIGLLYSTRSKLILSFLGIALLVCSVALFVGVRLIYGSFLNEATNRVSLDLNAAREIYESRIKLISTVVNLTSTGRFFRAEIERNDTANLTSRLRTVAEETELDFLGIVGKDGRNICRIRQEAITNDRQLPNPIADLVLQKQIPISGTMIVSHDFLFAEDPQLAERARIGLTPTRMAGPGAVSEELSGMALVAAVPIVESNKLMGVLYGGILLNQNHDIVDRVRDTVFRHEIYNGRSLGTATIFLKDVRISTNVMNPDGTRSVGTKASEQVTKHVLTRGKKWTDRAFVVDDWYITAYEPIVDVFGHRVGMLYAGVLGAKYDDICSNALFIFVLITVVGMATAAGLGYFIANRIVRPVSELIQASAEVSRGNLSPEIGPISKTEIGVLQKTFIEMLNSIRQRDQKQKAESETKLLQFEKQASIGKLAGGVAHEINNPLTGIFTFTHMLLRRNDLPEDVLSDLETISNETERVRKIVKGLLDFSRQTELNREPTDINQLCRSTVALIENQALIKNVSLTFEQAEGLPPITVDSNQMKSVLLNLVINALDATPTGGQISLSTGIGVSARAHGQKGVEIICQDTGCGIAPENIDKVFDPFFTTKEVGQGTGLGLSVSFGIVERHGGTIHVQSKVTRGSTFTIWLPIEEQDAKSEHTGS